MFHSSYIILYSHQLYIRVLISPVHHQCFLIVVILVDVKWYITVCIFFNFFFICSEFFQTLK